VKAVHLDLKPFACSFTGCGMRFAHKHVRDNHEKTGNHVYTPVSFLCLDESKLFCVHLGRHPFPTWIENDIHAWICNCFGFRGTLKSQMSNFNPGLGAGGRESAQL
jgi:hypothetical protein